LLPGLHPDDAHQVVTPVVVIHGTVQGCVLVVEQHLKLEPIVLFLSLNAPLEQVQEVAIEVFVANHWRCILDITFRKPGFGTMAGLQHNSCQGPTTSKLLTLIDLKMLPIDIPTNRIIRMLSFATSCTAHANGCAMTMSVSGMRSWVWSAFKWHKMASWSLFFH
jgi:hypothetical protein